MIFATVVTQVLSRTTTMLPAVKENRVSSNEYLRKFIPMSLLYAISLVLGNSAYKFISVVYIQMLKSSSPVIVLLLAICAGREKPSLVQLLITNNIYDQSWGNIGICWRAEVQPVRVYNSIFCCVL